MMIQVFFLCLLLIYYWYFYASFSKRISKPSIGSLPSKPSPFNFEFSSKQSNNFQFLIDGNTVWEHTLPVNTFSFHQGKIVETDPCYNVRDGNFVSAKGKILYEYMKSNPENKTVLKFKDDSQFTIQNGSVFYFKCSKGRIGTLEVCPSGTIFFGNRCNPINLCTNKQDGTLLPHQFAFQYILCQGENEHVKNCPKNTIFNHDRCESINDLNHYCEYVKKPFLLNDETRVECRDGKPFFVKCKPGTKFIDRDICEPANCLGLPDDTKLPLSERKADPFKFVPGYMTCRENKISKTVECPQIWDETLSRGDNLTLLPMVFDIKKNACSVPEFCNNVFSDDPDIIVPVHEFTKRVKNWSLSKLFDHAAGYVCENKIRKRKILPADKRISKKFKVEPACGPNMPERLPIFQDAKHYYDCASKSTISCPDSTFFNGSTCVTEPKNAFAFNKLPLFQFDSLNFESWIKPWDYSKDEHVSCGNPESTFVELYNICSHPDCENYAFVSQIPDMAILLPGEQKAKCKFYENERKLKKESVNFQYHFWNQKIASDGQEEEKPCRIGQNLETGNFIWDSTIFATCNSNYPFVFCPSTHSRRIIPVPGDLYACEPPNSTFSIFDRVDEWTPFEINEIKRILHVNWSDKNRIYIRRNKGTSQEILSQAGINIAKGKRINLTTSQPVKLELGYRVTHPPNVAFEYDDQQRTVIHTSSADRGFLIKLKNFSGRSLSFPTYKPTSFVESFNKFLYV